MIAVVAAGIAAYSVSVLWVFVLFFGPDTSSRYVGAHRRGGAS